MIIGVQVAVLIVLNIPLYLFIAWLVFDTKESAADTVLETIVALLLLIFTSSFGRALRGKEEPDASGLLPIAMFLIACGLITYGEYWLLQKYVFAI